MSTAAIAGSPVGSYTISAAAGADANYAITFVNGTLTVTRAALAITAQSKSKVYGAANPVLTATYSGFVNGDTPASLDTPVALATSATTASGVGMYPITASGAADANYSITQANGILTIARAGLTVRAENKSRAFNQPNPPLTATYTGFVNGDTPAALDSPVVLATTATQSSPAGTYPITAGGTADANYTVSHLNGTLTVAASPLFAAKINFQIASSPIPAGYLPDGGAAYGNRGNGFRYGWNINNSSFARDRNSTRSPDQRYDTLNHLQKPGGARTWEIAVPNGSYTVFLVAGDPDNIDSIFRINVEGIVAVSGTPNASTRWFSGTTTVAVNDGRLSISNGSGASNNKICFIDITGVASGGGGIATTIGGTHLEGPLRIAWISGNDKGRITLRLEGAVGGTYLIEASEDLKIWVPVASVPNLNGTIPLDDSVSASRSQRFYRAVAIPWQNILPRSYEVD